MWLRLHLTRVSEESGVPDKSDRLRLLSQWVPERGLLRIEEAARLLECSSMTVRRDVASAPERFVLMGGHIVAAGAGRLYDLNRELTVNVQAKEAVCANAIARLDDGDTIFIDCGMMSAPMANRPLSVVCSALNKGEPLARHSNVQLILLGGRYNALSASFEVADASSGLSRLGINKAFLSAAGVHATRGVTCANFHEVAIKRAAIALALEKHLLVDATKFGKVAPAAFAGLDEFDTITVSPAPEPGPGGEGLGGRV